MKGGRLPNALFPGSFPISEFGVSELQILSWNGRGVCMADSVSRSSMGCHVRRVSKLAHILCLQEVHGLEGDIVHQMSVWLPGWRCFASHSLNEDGSANPNAGGCCTLICPGVCALANFEHLDIVPGRCIGTSILTGDKSFSVCNVHNYGLSLRDIKTIKNFLVTLSSNVGLFPTKSFGVLVGDINIKAEHEGSFKVGGSFVGALRDRGFSNPLFSGQRLGQWRKILDNWTEISQPMPTHFDFATLSCSRIDRGWAFGPSDMLIKLNIRSHVVGTPEEYYGAGVSDHAPFIVFLGFKIKSACTNSVPKFVCKHPNFKMHVDSFSVYCDLENLPVHRKLATYKLCFKEASKKVLLDIQHDEAGSIEPQRLAFSSMSRAVWYNNVTLARKLLSSSSLAKTHISIMNGQVTHINPGHFSSAFNEVHSKFYQSQIKDLRSQSSNATSVNVKKQLKSRINCYQRLQGVFWPSGKRLSVTGIRISRIQSSERLLVMPPPPQGVGSSEVVHSPDEIQQALIEYWRPVYSVKPMDMNKAEQFLKMYVRRNKHLFEFQYIEDPSIDEFEASIKHARHSACGCDGIPYAAYQANAPLSARVLSDCFQDLSSDNPETDLEVLNKQIVWFVPKGASDDDKTALIRTPNNLRTIFGSNCDSKLISGTLAYKLTEPTLKVTPINQRGFCKGRQLSLNIVDVDFFMRVFNSEFDASCISSATIGDIPVCVLYDFCNAFPTILHKFLFLVLKMLSVPARYRNAIFNLYSKITAYSSGIGNGKFLFYVLCGVKTGCPLSSILFLLCVNPFIDLFRWLSDNPGFSLTRICADDFGSALKQLESLRTQASIFRLAGAVAGLLLKPSKCVIVVSCCILTDALVEAIRTWLAVEIPEFKDFNIASSGKYLGWHLGVNGTALSYSNPLKKLEVRVHEVVGGRAPATTSILRYNQRAVTVLSYVSQFAHPPGDAKIPDVDMWCVHKILRMPQRCFSRKLCHSISVCTEVDPIPLSAYCSANMIRFAHSERDYLLKLHSDHVTRIRQVPPREDEVPLRSVDTPNLHNNLINLIDVPFGGISDPPILVNLIHAINLSGPFSQFRVHCGSDSTRKWLVSYPIVPFPAHLKTLQSAALSALSVDCKVPSLADELHKKLKVTFDHFAPYEMPVASIWWPDCRTALLSVSPYLKTCWLKTIGGGWCTGIRLSTVRDRPCIFGCPDTRDEICHYLACPILWHLALETLCIKEESIFFLNRICVIAPTPDKLKTLAFCHSLYHSVVNDPECISGTGMPFNSARVQRRASEVCGFSLHMVGGRS